MNAISASTAAALCNPWRSPTVQESSGASESLFFKGVYVPDADDAAGIPSADAQRTLATDVL